MPRLEWTTVARAAAFAEVETVSASAAALMARMVSAVSRKMDTLISCATMVQSDTQRRPATRTGVFMLSNTPVRSIQQVRYSASGDFTDATTLSPGSYALHPDADRITGLPPRTSGAYEVSYTGGWAYATERTVYAATASGGTPTPGTFVQPDGRSITVLAWDGTNLTFKPTIGTFMQGDVLTMGAVTVMLGAAVQESIANDYPEFEMVAAMQVTYWWKRHQTLGKRSSTMGGTTSWEGDYKVLEDNIDTLKPATRVFGFM